MEVKVGVQFGSRELVIESNEKPEDIQAALDAALVKGGLFTLVDEKGRRVSNLRRCSVLVVDGNGLVKSHRDYT